MSNEDAILAAPADPVPWFELQLPNSNKQARVEVASLPFSVGRSKTTDMILASRQVSRVQARIVRVGNELRIRDNGSRNGTFVNGEKIEDATLQDGDEVTFADVTFRFRLPAAQTGNECDGNNSKGIHVSDIVNRVRQMHEVIVHRAFSNRFLPIVRLQDRVIVGQDYLGLDNNLLGTNSTDLQLLLDIDCPLTRDMHHMLRLAATEDFKEENRKGLLFLNLQKMELTYQDLLWQFCRLVDVTEKPEFLVIGVPFETARQIPQLVDMIQFIHSLKLRIAFTEFRGRPDELQEISEFPVDFVKIHESLTENIEESSERQDEVFGVVQAAAERNSIVMASGINTATECDICQTLGCYLGEGPFFT